jgi:REP element-mobilizing transposase RayT
VVLAYHVIVSAYGFWLPNDERGSWSEFVGAWELLRFGRATTSSVRHSLAYEPMDWKRREEAQRALKYPPVVFNGVQARAIARGFAAQLQTSGITFYACSILPDHIHFVMKRHRYEVEFAVNLLKGAATRQLIAEGIHPHERHRTRSGRHAKAFSRGQWKVFLDSEADVRRAAEYVEENPPKEHLRRQPWWFVAPLA